MAKMFCEPLTINFQGTRKKPWQSNSKPTRKTKILSRSLSDPTQWGKHASRKTHPRCESGANSTSGGFKARVARRKSSQGLQRATGQNNTTRRALEAQRSARPAPKRVGVKPLPQQPKRPTPLILKQPRLAYYSYMPPDSPEVSALKHVLQPTEDKQWEEFTMGRVRCAEAQGAVATAGPSWTDCCTCMCCVKALFYHCTKDDDDDDECHVDVSADPCSCQGPGAECAGRWGILGVLSMCMPCMLCYPLIQAANRDSQY